MMMSAYFLGGAAAFLSFSVVTGQDLACKGSCVRTWEQCAGDGIASGTMRPCCSSDEQCVQQDSSYSHCRPVRDGIPARWPSGDILTCAGLPSPASTPLAQDHDDLAVTSSLYHGSGKGLRCDGPCVGTWGKCAGKGVAAGTRRLCCTPGDRCVQKNQHFSQCRPAATRTPASWPSGAVLPCRGREHLPPTSDSTTTSTTATPLLATTRPSADSPPTPPSSTGTRGCDPAEVSVRLEGVAVVPLLGETPIEWYDEHVDWVDQAEVGALEATCEAECHANADCVAFQDFDGMCDMFGDALFSHTPRPAIQPVAGSHLHLTKCFLPEPLCRPGTDEVRIIDPAIAYDGRSHQMDASGSRAAFYVSPPEAALVAAITVCRLHRHDVSVGPCIGFAIETTPSDPGQGREPGLQPDALRTLTRGGLRSHPGGGGASVGAAAARIVPLFRAGDGTTAYQPAPEAAVVVYSITGCL